MKILDRIIILLIVYPFGGFLAFLFNLLRVLGWIRISHRERFPHSQGNLIIFSNHPSVLEPILLALMCYKGYLRHPFILRPMSTPDKENYYDRWYWHWLLKFIAVPIDRNDRKKGLKTFIRLTKILFSGGILIIFGEGGRTDKGERFIYSERGNKIRELKQGITSLIKRTNSSVVYVWVKGAEKVMPIVSNGLYTYPRFWKSKITIKIGKTVKFPRRTSREEIIQRIASDLLKLADEGE